MNWRTPMSNSKRILAALLAMIGIAGYFFWKKKNEKEDAAGDGSN